MFEPDELGCELSVEKFEELKVCDGCLEQSERVVRLQFRNFAPHSSEDPIRACPDCVAEQIRWRVMEIAQRIEGELRAFRFPA